MFKKEIFYPNLSLAFLSLGGLLLHIRIHPPSEAAIYWFPAIIGVVCSIILPFMFNYSTPARWAFLITMISVIGGIITMADYSIDHPPQNITFVSIMLRTTVPDIIILLAKLPLAIAILQFWRSQDKKS